MNTAQQNKLGPFIALKIAFLMHAGELKNTFITLISFSFFLAYLLNGTLGYKWINKFGYKKTLIRGLLVMVCGLTVFFFSSWFTVRYENLNVLIAGAHIPYSYFIFLFGSYLMGTSATLLQVVINPYVAAYEVKGTQPVQRMNIVCAFNSFGTTIAPFFVTGVMFGGLAIEEVQVKQLMVPFLILAAFIAFTAFITQRLYLPDVMHTKAAKGEKLERSIWSLGVIAIFFYVGAEVSIGVNVNLNALELENSGQTLSFFGMKHIVIGGIDFGLPALLATLYWGGLMVGRIVSSYLKHISPRIQLTVTTILAASFTLIALVTNNLWLLVTVGLFHSVMWGCIFTLAITGLNKYTSKASGVFMMGVFGGAVFPFLQGILADSWGSWQYTWILVVICELVMLYYALLGSKIRKTDEVENTP